MENDIDSSDSEQEFVPSADLINKLTSIEDRMKAYPSYELHLEKVNVLKEMKDATRLLQAYEDFSKAFPLTPELWLGWIYTTIEKIENEDIVLSLFSTAVKDYLGVHIWVEYINYAAICLNDELKDENWVRKIYEDALLLPALHVCEGINIWKAALEFEKRLYNFCKDDEESSDQKTKLKKHQDILIELFHRMFSLPLIGIVEEMDKFKTWLTEEEISLENMDDIVQSFMNSENKLLSIMPHEKKLERCTADDIFKYDVFPKYIDFIQNALQFSTPQVICLYERMIEQFPIEPSVWLKYLKFLKNADDSKIASTAERSVRNCPYSAELRVEYIKAMEQSSDAGTVKELYNGAMEIPYDDPLQLIQVWKHYVYFLGRLHSEGTDCGTEMEELFRNTSKVINKYFFNHKSNARTKFLMQWAEVKSNILKDTDAARDVWSTKILVKNDKSVGKLWSKYLDFEKKYGTPETVREAYSNAMTYVYNGAEQISEKWLEFEKENGNSEQLNEAVRRCEVRLQNLGVEEKEHSDKDWSRSRDGVSPNKYQKQTSKNTFQPRSINIKPSQNRPSKRKMNPTTEEGNNPKTGSGDYKSGQWQRLGQESHKESKPTNTYIPTAVDEQRTVFLSNLDFTVTEEDVKTIFEKAVGPIEHVKLKLDFKGRSKGFGHIVYQSQESVDVALKMDHTMIKGRPAFVSKYNSDKNTRKHFFAFSSSQEKNKLFVKGLSFNTTRDTLMDLFSKHGTVKDVRVVTYRSGKSKGLAYIDFETEDMANKALEATNGTEVDSHKIVVAISQPSLSSDRLPAEEPLEKLIRKSNTRLMLPSNVKLPQKKPKLDMDTDIVSGTNVSQNSSSKLSEADTKKTDPPKSTGLSNADFRNMLLKKK